MSARRRVQHTLRKNVREWLRKRGRPIQQTMALEDQGDAVRVSIQKAAFDEHDQVPDTVEQYYDPDQHVIVMPLPEPETATATAGRQDRLGSFDNTDGDRKRSL